VNKNATIERRFGAKKINQNRLESGKFFLKQRFGAKGSKPLHVVVQKLIRP
jgi:ribosomal protein L27